MRKVGVVSNSIKDKNYEYGNEIVSWLEENGHGAVFAKIEENDYSVLSTICQTCEFLVVLGGDGTILEVARNTVYCNLPIMGINLGTLGYLTDADKSEGIKAIENVLNGNFKTEKRMMLEAKIKGKENDEKLAALNDICVLRGSISKMINLKIMVNDEYIDTYRADGIIISTPTGSTAYNLSAGGPILKPDIELIAITPICPHKMYSRPIVVSAEDTVSISIEESHEDDVILSFDGQVHIPLSHGDKIDIKKSSYHTTVIKTGELGFFDILRKKFYY